MEQPKVVNILCEIKDPGPQPAWPGDEPPLENGKDAHMSWYEKTRVYGEWFKKNRRYLIAQLATTIGKKPHEERSPVEEIVVLLAAMILEESVAGSNDIFSMLGLKA